MRKREPMPSVLDVAVEGERVKVLYTNGYTERLSIDDARRATTDPRYATWLLQRAAGWHTDERIEL